MTDDRPPDGERPDEDRSDESGQSGEDRGLLGDMPKGMRWLPFVLALGAVAFWEYLAPDTFRGEEGAWGNAGYLLGFGLVVAAFVVVAVIVRGRGDD